MTIKKRIFISNTLIVFISLVLLLAVGGTIVVLFKDEVMTQYSQNSKVSSNASEVVDILSKTTSSPNSKELTDDLKKYDFRVYVKRTADTDDNYKKILKHSEAEAIESLLKTDIISDGVYFIENTTIVKKSINNNGTTYDIYAVNCPKENSILGLDRGLFEMLFIVFLTVGLICVGVILILSQLVTKMLIKTILKPADELGRATVRVSEGNLSKSINYTENDEFKAVCEGFDLMQDNLKQGIEKNEAYEKARTEMVSGISHDLRTPLTSVKGFIKGILDGIADTPEKQRQYLEIAYKKAGDMDVLLEKLFYFSKLETGNMPFFKANTDITEFIAQYVLDKQSELDVKNTELTYDNFCDNSVMCSIDTTQIKRVIDNIVENSIKYSQANPLKIKLITSIENNSVVIKISDNGAGIDDEKINHIFEQFYRADESRTDSGNGLGLYVCLYIIKEHGGTITAENNNGLCITINLPINQGV